ncbi:uncharacterized protein LOC110456940 [Mizuhopecten yessoensis]|uniref:FAD-binding domain-containing protein n=1 Tax=Mizuhopecten yessoensis TaxID=6573 RepID=A0A210Q9V1_MIZYE|nr:uncharacterized protein LOC110456940 [Mizuhopecten yessoensis]OWF45512.1 hypothetical protein KP79_PYT01563 [Mizuhopecten yessoensis]
MAPEDFPDGLLLSRYAEGHLYLTVIFLLVFLGGRVVYRQFRRMRLKLAVVIVGAGPVGLTATFIAMHNPRVGQITVYEEAPRERIINSSYQITLDATSFTFLESIGVDFNNIEGCRESGLFYTQVGVYLQYILEQLQCIGQHCQVRFGSKFDKDVRKSLETEKGRTLVIVCDGKKGQSARLLGLDDFTEEVSCQTYGAMAGIERPHLREVPTQEIRAHHLNFDLSAYGPYGQDQNGSPGFSLKIFGNSKYRYVCLAIKKCESPTLKALRTILDRSMMRNIFLKCFNTYKLKSEPGLSESFVLNHMKYSPRLFEVRYTQRYETVAYFDDCDMFVVVEGDAALSCNFHTGMDINQGIRGLHSLHQFITMVTWAESEQSISSALAFKMQHSSKLFSKLSRDGMHEFMFS